MAITIEGYSVVAQRERIQHLLDRDEILVNSTAMGDDHLWRCCFMTHDDAVRYIHTLAELGLNVTQGPDSDAVMVSEFHRELAPYCEWLQIAAWEKAVIAWKVGTDSKSIVARQGWDPKIGSGLEYRKSISDNLEFLRLDGNVEVYWDTESRQEVYVGRTEPAVAGLFESAVRILRDNWRTAGEPAVQGKNAGEVTGAIGMLDKVIDESPADWRGHWFQGKGYLALGNAAAAYDCFERAFELEKNEEVIAREFSGACLELGRFDRAVEQAERAVVLVPDNHELLGNLALAHLMAGHVEAAQKTVQAADKFDSLDQINGRIRQLIEDVASGKRPPPQSMAELRSPPKRKPRWKFW